MSLTIEPIPAFNDNYIWLIHNADGEAFVVDPGDATPVLATLKQRDLNLVGILLTHHHPDHTGGVAGLKAAMGCQVWGPHNPAITGVDAPLAEGDCIDVLGEPFRVIEVPGHTLDHIAYYRDAILFCGDTLFAGGCGRVFEGTFPMMRRSLDKLRGLPANTRVYCAHEYTLSNLRFATAVEPSNEDLIKRVARCQALRTSDVPTVPSSLSEELVSNPFLRWDNASVIELLQREGKITDTEPDTVFAALRQWKDVF